MTATDYADLRAVYVNGTLKRSPGPSYLDAGSGGPLRGAWNDGERFGLNPEYR